ncbi:hypothetical protein BGZ88_004984, partial [Linnemannia elongata]
YVQKVRIITADGQVRWVERGRTEDKDLLYAILGGSPGNFGVLTDVTLNVLKDEDHPESRGFRACSLTVKPLSSACWTSWSIRTIRQILQKILNAGGVDKAMHCLGIFLNGKAHTPMSVLCSHWILPVARVFPFPFHKHTYFSNSNSKALKAKGWTRWVSGRIQELAADPSSGYYAGAQFQYCGGIHSRFIRNAKDRAMSFSWRDSQFMLVLAAAYDVSVSKDAEKIAKVWVDKNDSEDVGHPGAKFSAQDRRVLWGSYDLDLPAARKYYFDQEPEKYDRLSGIKKAYDPSHVFTPNKFCIGPLPTHVLDADKTRGAKYAFSNAMQDADKRANAVDHLV